MSVLGIVGWLAANVIVLLGLAFLLRLVLPRIRRLRPGEAGLATGLAFGLVAIGTMQAAAVSETGVVIDLRHVAVVSAAIFGGPIAAFISAVMAAMYRLTLGGPLLIGAVLSIFAAAAIGTAFVKHWTPRRAPKCGGCDCVGRPGLRRRCPGCWR